MKDGFLVINVRRAVPKFDVIYYFRGHVFFHGCRNAVLYFRDRVYTNVYMSPNYFFIVSRKDYTYTFYTLKRISRTLELENRHSIEVDSLEHPITYGIYGIFVHDEDRVHYITPDHVKTLDRERNYGINYPLYVGYNHISAALYMLFNDMEKRGYFTNFIYRVRGKEYSFKKEGRYFKLVEVGSNKTVFKMDTDPLLYYIEGKALVMDFFKGIAILQKKLRVLYHDPRQEYMVVPCFKLKFLES